MNKYKKVSKEEVLEMFYDLQTKFWKVGCWAEGISVDFLAHEMADIKIKFNVINIPTIFSITISIILIFKI